MFKILVVNNTLPDIRGFTTILFKNLLPILKEKMNVEIIWVVHTTENFSRYKISENEKIIKMNDFKNAVEILKKEKPNLIYIIPGINAPDYAFSLAAKFLNIFRIGGELGNNLFSKKYSGLFSQLSISHNYSKKKQILQFIQKHKFLINTQREIGWSYFRILKDLISIVFNYYFPLFGTQEMASSKFELDQHYVESEVTIKKLMSYGFDKSKIIITGNPSYDELFKKAQKKEERQNDEKFQILVLTTTIIGDSKKKTIEKRNLFISEIIKKIEHKEKNEIFFKIHPTHENLNEYKKIVNSIDPKIIIYQKEELVDLIKKADLIISPVSSTSVVSALIQKKPIIIWNVFEVQNDSLLENKLALECKDPNELGDLVEKSKTMKISDKKIEEFIAKYLFKADGKAAERIADAIFKLAGKNCF